MAALYEYSKNKIFYCHQTGEHHCERCKVSLGRGYYLNNQLIPRCTMCGEIFIVKTEAHVLKNYDGELDNYGVKI